MLLLCERTALVLGSLGLFAALAIVMVLTRRVDWSARRRTELGAVKHPTSKAGQPVTPYLANSGCSELFLASKTSWPSSICSVTPM